MTKKLVYWTGSRASQVQSELKPHLLATIVSEMFTITYFVFASVLEPFWGEMNIVTSESPRRTRGKGKAFLWMYPDYNDNGLEGGYELLLCICADCADFDDCNNNENNYSSG